MNLTTKNRKKIIIKKINQIEKKIENRYIILGKLATLQKQIELEIKKIDKEISGLENKISKLCKVHKKLSRKN